ncbi:hypothetical protein JGK52_09765 [Cytobacillus oceanisediminis]|uniref:hypothetical protein n=1 Tax=Cytobacillus oceanisediminis TaxID=665099 RepID=UPI001D147BB1|nr:hypothetical protein [Cytobacillus oceanisediminis]MCC3646962.1 hypothetical protein [Cytobacillus oceanisediminis]
MQVFATFDHSPYLELAIRKLEQQGITDIYSVPLDNRTEDPGMFDTIHKSDGVSLINKGMVLAVMFSVVGASRGFILEWGPIYWGLIGAAVGFLLGFAIDFTLIKLRTRNKRLLKGVKSEVVLIIGCHEEEGKQVEAILWEHFANGVARVN